MTDFYMKTEMLSSEITIKYETTFYIPVTFCLQIRIVVLRGIVSAR